MALLPRAIADKIQRMLSTDDKQSDGWKDATSGKVLEVGSFGLGVVNTTRLDDCNDTSIESINGYFVVTRMRLTLLSPVQAFFGIRIGLPQHTGDRCIAVHQITQSITGL